MGAPARLVELGDKLDISVCLTYKTGIIPSENLSNFVVRGQADIKAAVHGRIRLPI